ncbi:response regulator transcription factor [Chitinophagaceae bacterium MMS25-I14]
MINSTQVSNTPIRIVTADDHIMVRTGLQVMLELKFGISDIYEADSCATTLSAIRQHKPTHLIIDMVFKDGNSIEILPAIKKLAPGLQIMVYSMLPTAVYLPALQRFGINHYLNKESPRQSTLQMLHNFLYREDPQKNSGLQQEEPQHANPFTRLSTRELEVLHYLLKGETSRFAATELNLHISTISTLKSRILEKIGVKNLKGLLDMAALHNYNI